MTRFSIIIPTYNYATTLPRAISSALAQTGDDFEILIVDDGSTDNSADIIAGFQKEAPAKIRTWHQPNSGVATARNRGIKESQGEFLLFLDADDVLLPETLTILRNVLEARENAQVVIGAHIKVDALGKEKYCGNPSLSSDPHKRFAHYLDKKLYISNGAILFARAIFDKIHFPEQFRCAEDMPVFAQSLALFNTVGIEEPLVKVYGHAHSLRHDAQAAMATGLALVDAIFNPAILPTDFFVYRQAFYVRRCLSLFRTLVTAGYAKQARGYYYLAIKADWQVLLKPEYWRKYLVSFLTQSK